MPHDTINTVLIIGRPGSGKGTQASRLATKTGWKHFSTGERFKQLRDEESRLGEQVREAYDAGKLLPDWFGTYMFEDMILKLGHEEGLVCDGYPRSLGQAQSFDDIVTWLGRSYAVLDLVVSEEEAMRRQLERSKVEHRPDSGTEEKIRIRFAEYRDATEPIFEFFREKGFVTEINGEQTPEKVELDIARALKIA